MINEALRLIRVYHNLKQGDLADKLNMSQSHLSEIEKGHKQPTYDILERYSAVFDIPVSSIIFFAERKDVKKGGGIEELISKKALGMLSWLENISSTR